MELKKLCEFYGLDKINAIHFDFDHEKWYFTINGKIDSYVSHDKDTINDIIDFMKDMKCNKILFIDSMLKEIIINELIENDDVELLRVFMKGW